MGRKKPSLKLRHKNDLIGLVVLSLGVVALLVVGYVAYQKFTLSESEVTIEQNDIDDFKRLGNAPNRAAGEKTVSKKVIYKRQGSISEKEVSGVWQARMKKGQGLLEMEKGRYKLVIIPSKKARTRYFASGTYNIKADIITLMPDSNQRPPQSDAVKYIVLTRSKMPLMASKHKGKLIWQMPPPNAGIYVPPYHPVLNRSDDRIVVWDVLD